jgi:hypothetical protein
VDCVSSQLKGLFQVSSEVKTILTLLSSLLERVKAAVFMLILLKSILKGKISYCERSQNK